MRRARAGQTLLEVIIAISVVAVGLMSVIGLATSNSANAQINSDRTVATALAREGLEVVKHLRDSNWLRASSTYLNILTREDGTSQNYDTAVPRLSFDSGKPVWSLNFGDYPDLASPDASPDTVVSWIGTAGEERFAQPNGTRPTRFRRHLVLHALCQASDTSQRGTSFAYRAAEGNSCGSNEVAIGVQVLSEVTWRQALGARWVRLELRLFDWR